MNVEKAKAMTISDYIRSKGLTVRLVAQKMGVRRQAIENYGRQLLIYSRLRIRCLMHVRNNKSTKRRWFQQA